MITTIVSDFSYVLLFPKEESYQGTLNGLYRTLTGNFNFFDYYRLNNKLLEYYKSLKSQKLSINIFTSGSLQNNLQIKKILEPIFDHIWSAQELGLEKSDIESYRIITKKLGEKPEEIVFVDDQLVNVEAAREAGMQIVYYTNSAVAIKKLSSLVK